MLDTLPQGASDGEFPILAEYKSWDFNIILLALIALRDQQVLDDIYLQEIIRFQRAIMSIDSAVDRYRYTYQIYDIPALGRFHVEERVTKMQYTYQHYFPEDQYLEKARNRLKANKLA